MAIAAFIATWASPRAATGPLLWSGLLVLSVLPWIERPSRRDGIDLLIAAGWFIIALLPRLAELQRLPLGLHGDEARHVLVALEIQRIGFEDFFGDRAWGIPTPGFLTQLVGVTLFGPGIDVVRAVSAVAGATTVSLVYLWGRELVGRWLGALAAGLLIAAHSHLLISHLGTVNALAPLLTTLVIWLLTVAWRRRSASAASLAAVACTLTFLNWSGARIIVLIVVAVLVVLVSRRQIHLVARPLSIFALSIVLLACAPLAYYQRVPNGWSLALARADKSVLHPVGWSHSVSSLPEPSVAALAERQTSNTLRAFVPGGTTDTSTFYQFARPFVDPMTLLLVTVGTAALVTRRRVSLAWIFPLLVIPLTLASTALIVDPPNYTRLALMLPSLALVGGYGVIVVSVLIMELPWARRLHLGPITAISLVTLIGLVNLRWFFVDYPSEGRGEFVYATLANIAREYQAPVYILDRGVNYGHEIFALLDSARHIQEAPKSAREPRDPRAVWATLAPPSRTAFDALAVANPGHTTRVYRDNRGQAIVTTLVPPSAR